MKKLWILLMGSLLSYGASFACWSFVPPEEELMYQLMQPISQYYQEKGHLKEISPLIAQCVLKHTNPVTQKACQKLQTTFLGEIKTTPFTFSELSWTVQQASGVEFKAPLGFHGTRVAHTLQLGDWFFAVPEGISSITRGPIYQGFLVAKMGDTHRSPLFSLSRSKPDFYPFFIQLKEGKLILGFHTTKKSNPGIASEKLWGFVAEGKTFKQIGCYLYYPEKGFDSFFLYPNPDTLIKRPLDEAICWE